MNKDGFSILNVIVAVAVIIIFLHMILSGPITDRSQQAHRVMVQVNLRNLAIAGCMYMDEYDVNSVTYKNIIDANLIQTPLRVTLGEDYSTFEMNNVNTTVEITIPDGNNISVEIPTYIKKVD